MCLGLLRLTLCGAPRLLLLSFIVQMFVDTSRDSSIRLEFDITFLSLPCAAVMMDVGDGTGQIRTEASMARLHNGELHKYELDRNGQRLYRHEYIPPRQSGGLGDGAFTFMLNLDPGNLQQMNAAIAAHNGCNLVGWADLARVPGNVHFAVRPEALFASMNARELMSALLTRHLELGGEHGEDAMRLNASHSIQKLRFGEPSHGAAVNVLEGTRRVDRKATGLDRYFLRVVPTTVHGAWHRPRKSAQYAASEFYTPLTPKSSSVLPGILFSYDIHPIAVKVTEFRLGILHFFVRAAAVVGGVFALTGACDRVVHRLIAGPGRRRGRSGAVPSSLPVGAALRYSV